MYFDPSFFQGETREDFYIRPMVKKAWAAQLEVLEKIDIICKRHNIMYYAEWGTLLGAIRHQGFVPWDDDMDIGMRRVDFTRFIHYAKQELPEGYQILTVHETAKHRELIARIVNTLTINTEPAFLEQFHGCPYVVGIDIFITDNIPKNKNEEEIQLRLIDSVYALGHEWNHLELSEDEKRECLSEIEELCNIKFTNDKPMRQQLLVLCDRLCSMYWDAQVDDVALMLKLADYPHYRLPVSCYESTIDVPFEHITIPVPVGYEQILRLRYGDYTIRYRGGGSHNYPFYKEQMELLHNEYKKRGLNIPEEFLE